ncbi:MAG: endonuclease III [Planctomycetota bacterium]
MRARRIHDTLLAMYPDAVCELDFATPFQLLIATILSAQSTDRQVNSITPALFARYPDAAAMAVAEPADVEHLIHSTGFFRQKTKSVIGCSKKLVARFGGEVPPRMEDLVTLDGVGRKTANVVLGVAFGINAGMPVDTHVKRISGLLALTSHTDPEKIEPDLLALIPQDSWRDFSLRIIWHGRRVCTARNPDCDHCELAPMCPSRRAD